MSRALNVIFFFWQTTLTFFIPQKKMTKDSSAPLLHEKQFVTKVWSRSGKSAAALQHASVAACVCCRQIPPQWKGKRLCARSKLYKIEALPKAANKQKCTHAHTHTRCQSVFFADNTLEVGDTRLPLFDFFAVVSQSPCWRARCPAGSSAGRPRSWTPATTRTGWRSPLAGPPPRIWTWALGISVQSWYRKWRKTDV